MLFASPLALVIICSLNRNSQIKHDPNNLTSENGIGKLNCVESYTDSAVALSYRTYSETVLHHLISASRDLIPDFITADTICVEPLTDYSINATAQSSGTVSFHYGLLWAVENDAQFAFVAAHELAHLVSSHSFAPASHEGLMQNTEYRALVERLKLAIDQYYDAQIRRDKIKNLLSPKGISSIIIEGYDIALIALTTNLLSEKRKENPEFLNQTTQSLLASEFDPSNRGISDNFVPEEAFYKNVTDLVRITQDYLLNIHPVLSIAERQEIQTLQNELINRLDIFNTESDEMGLLFERKEEIEIEYLGNDRGANWAEQDADEKGLEIFLRAGYKAEEAKNMLHNLQVSSENASRMGDQIRNLAIQSEISQGVHLAESNLRDHLGNNCSRGNSSHPASCWRVSNIDSEIETHREEYGPYLNNTKIDAFGGKLEDLQSQLFIKTFHQLNLQTGDGTNNTASGGQAMVGGYTCEQQKEWGKCEEPWMSPTCDAVCNR